jgi:hypothetical protein
MQVSLDIDQRATVLLYTDRLSPVTASLLAESLIVTPSLATQSENPLMLQVRSLAAKGWLLPHALSFTFIQTYITHLQYVADSRVTELAAANMAALSPDRSRKNRIGSLEVVYLTRLPDSVCEGILKGVQGLFCPSENRVYAWADQQTGDTTRVGRDQEFVGSFSAVLFHELAHAYLNPAKAEEMPFIAEALATAEGERTLRSLHAALNASRRDPRGSAENLKHFMTVLGRPEPTARTVPPDPQKPDQYAAQWIRRAPLTRFQERALCSLQSDALSTDFLVKQLTLSIGSFNTQTPEERALAYYAAWALMHFGYDAGGSRQGFDQRIDVRLLNELAVDILANTTITPAKRDGLSKVVQGIRSEAAKLRRERRVNCVP